MVGGLPLLAVPSSTSVGIVWRDWIEAKILSYWGVLGQDAISRIETR